MRKRVVITGGSAISPIGTGWEEIEENLRSLKNGIKTMKEWYLYKRMNTKLAAPALWKAPQYPRKKSRGMGKVALLSVHATEMALKDAELLDNPILNNGETGVSYGSSTGNVNALMDFYSMLIDHNIQGVSATTYIKSMPQTCAVNIGVFFGLKGRLFTSNTACTSGSLSIGLGFESIREGKQKVMVCGGSDELNPTESAVFDTLFATSTKNDTPHITPSPFDINRDGLVVGEGAGTLILEELDHALQRGATIHAELIGFGTNSDGTHITQPNQDTMEIALKLALDDADLSPDQIDYINGHGTATEHGDIAESHATYNCFNQRYIPFSTLKSYTGHTLGACGVIETWLAIKMMNTQWIAPNLNLIERDPRCAQLDYIIGKGREMNPKHIMCNNFAFGGINTSLILKRWDCKD